MKVKISDFRYSFHYETFGQEKTEKNQQLIILTGMCQILCGTDICDSWLVTMEKSKW